MSTQRVEPDLLGRPEGTSSAELRGRWLVAVRAAWVAIVLGTAILFTVSVPTYFSVLHDACHAEFCIGGQPSSGDLRALHDLGLPIDLYAAYVFALDLVVALGFCAVGAIIFWRKSRERAALFASFALVMFGLTWPGTFETVERFGAWGEPVGGFLFELALFTLLVFLLVFPDGRFVPRWTRWVAVLALVQLVSYVLFPGSFLVDLPQVLNVSAFVGLWATCSFAQAYRYWRVSGPVERQQTKWLMLGVAALVALLCVYLLPLAFFAQLHQPGAVSLSYDLVGRALVGSFAFLLIPLSIGVAILRHRLYDIDLIINRTLVYGSLTATLVAVYYGSVVLSQELFRFLTGQESQLAIVASTLAIAGVFVPLERRTQALIDRLFYRRKYNATKTLEAFSDKLRDETDLDALSEDLVGVVRKTMQPTRISLWVRPDPEPEDRGTPFRQFGHGE